jgi:hypothetical protein
MQQLVIFSYSGIERRNCIKLFKQSFKSINHPNAASVVQLAGSQAWHAAQACRTMWLPSRSRDQYTVTPLAA